MTTPGAQWQHPGTASSATDDRGQGRQIHLLQPIMLMQFANASEGNVGSVDFRVTIPDSRLRCKISIIGKPTGATAPTFIGGKGLTLWLRAVDDAQQGGNEIPITNLWGSSATPGPIPGELDNTGTPVAVTTLGGFSKEFVTAGDAIVGTVDYPEIFTSGTGLLLLQVRYTPENIRFPRDEWNEIRGQCGAAVRGYPLLAAA